MREAERPLVKRETPTKYLNTPFLKRTEDLRTLETGYVYIRIDIYGWMDIWRRWVGITRRSLSLSQASKKINERLRDFSSSFGRYRRIAPCTELHLE